MATIGTIVASAQRVDGDAGRGVAGDDDRFRILAAQELHDGDGATADVLLGTIAVRRVAGVCDVDQIFGGQLATDLAQDRQAADPGIEHANRSRASFGIWLLVEE